MVFKNLVCKKNNANGRPNMNLERFIQAQERDYSTALKEIRSGKKQSHWIWYIFPQLKWLGHSYYSNYYGIVDAEEAKAYYEHTLLGKRLKEISIALLQLPENLTAKEILGGIDARKVRSSMTLFYILTRDQLFKKVLNRYFEGKEDRRTRQMLGIANH